jgi:ABC-2 type transport system ATP-binding protein
LSGEAGAPPEGGGESKVAPEAMVVLESMTRRYGGVTAVDSLSLRVERGEMFGLIGPDGAGKTSTLRVVLGLLAAHGGRVLTCGLDPFRQRRAVSRKAGYLPQRFSLYGDLSVDENVGFFADVHGVGGWKARRDEILEMLRLAPFRARLADQLSGGMKQKLALACTLIHTPDLLVLDEPTTGVDPVSRRDFWKILVRLQRDGLTILLTTPYLDEAERCQRVALLDRGRLLALDSPDRLRRLTRGATLEVLAKPRRRAAEILAAMGDVTDVETFGERLHVSLAGVPPSEGAAAAERISAALSAAGVAVESARSTLPTLEDVFIARIREAESRRGALNEVSP